MAQSRLIGDYPVIGIRPTIDGRRGKIKVRESRGDQLRTYRGRLDYALFDIEDSRMYAQRR